MAQWVKAPDIFAEKCSSQHVLWVACIHLNLQLEGNLMASSGLRWRVCVQMHTQVHMHVYVHTH